MKLVIDGNRLYLDGLMFSHAGVKYGRGDKHFSGEAEPLYSHHHRSELLHVDGLGWVGGQPSCDIVLGRVVSGTGDVIPCRTTEARLMGIVNFTTEQGKRITLEIERG